MNQCRHILLYRNKFNNLVNLFIFAHQTSNNIKTNKNIL